MRCRTDSTLTKSAAVNLAVAGICFALSWASRPLAIGHTGASPIGLATGAEIVALLLGGKRLAPGVAIGSLSAALSGSVQAPHAVLISVTETAGCLLSAGLLRRARLSFTLDKPRDVAILIGLGAALGPLPVSALGPLGEWASGALGSSRLPMVMLNWWVGEATGILVMAPAFLLVVSILRPGRARVRFPYPGEFAVTLALFVSVVTVEFVASLRMSYLLFAFGTLLAIRSRTIGAISAAVLLWAVSIPTTAAGLGPFGAWGFHNRFLGLDSLVASFAIMVFTLAAAINDRDRSAQQVKQDKIALEEQLRVIEKIERDAARERAEAQEVHDRLQAQLFRSLRLESLGQLTGGIAHDFNNLLGVIVNYASYVAKRLRHGSLGGVTSDNRMELASDVDQIREAADQGAALTRRLLSFARQEQSEARIVDVNASVRASSDLLERTLGREVSLEVRTTTEDLRVVIGEGHIEQVIVNLALNARDAVEGRGKVVISTDSVAVGTELTGMWPGMPRGRYALVSVIDDGTGMDETTKEKAFDPFFTTKHAGEGTGLGLSTVYGVITGAGGQVCIDSVQGRGTTVSAILPMVETGKGEGKTGRENGDAGREDGDERPELRAGHMAVK